MKAIIHISEDLFRYLFVLANRENNFTHEGLGLLYQHLSAFEEEGKPQELNVVDLCMRYFEVEMSQFAKEHELVFQDVVELESDEEGEVIDEEIVDYDWEDMSFAQLEDCIRDYLEDSSKHTLIGFTEDTVIYY